MRNQIDDPRPWLSEVINLLAFGTTVPHEVGANAPILEKLAPIRAKMNAASALFEAARTGAVSLFGDVRLGGDRHEAIPAAYFDVPRNLGPADNSIQTDLGTVDMDMFVLARRGEHLEWFNVRVDHSTLLQWIGRVTAPLYTARVDTPIYDTGAVGRPTSMHLILTEARSRLTVQTLD